MKQRNDFVSNSSSSSFIVPIDKVNHDKSKWLENTLQIEPDTNRVMMKFDDFNDGYENFQNDVDSMWKFVCTQLMYWICPDLAFDQTRESIAKIMRKIHNNPEYRKLDEAVKNYLGCDGIEFDQEDLRKIKYEDNNDYYVILVPDCSLNHNIIYDGFDDMMNQAGVTSIPELIWGIKELRIIRD